MGAAPHDALCERDARLVKGAYSASFAVGVVLLMWGLFELVAFLGWDYLEPRTWIVEVGLALLLWFFFRDSLKPEKVEAWWLERRRRQVYAAEKFDEARFAELERKEN